MARYFPSGLAFGIGAGGEAEKAAYSTVRLAATQAWNSASSKR